MWVCGCSASKGGGTWKGIIKRIKILHNNTTISVLTAASNNEMYSPN